MEDSVVDSMNNIQFCITCHETYNKFINLNEESNKFLVLKHLSFLEVHILLHTIYINIHTILEN